MALWNGILCSSLPSTLSLLKSLLENEMRPPARKPKRVFLVDQFSIVRLAVAEWLNRTADLTVCGQADTATRALALIEQLKPDIVVTEILGQQDLEFIETLHKRHRRLPILVFSFRDETWMRRARWKPGRTVIC
jgi:DNA-binding NarL/FixJ family response regulator